MQNPYEHFASSLVTPARRVLTITPDDDSNLTQVCKTLRIFNATGDVATVAYVTVGGDTVTVSVPDGAITFEPAVVTKVLETGTTADLEIHGYTD